MSKYGEGNSDAGMRQVEKVVSTVHEVDIAVIFVRPSVRPGIHNFEIVAAIAKMGMPSDDRYAPDCEMMIVPKMSVKMGIIYAPPFLHVFVVPLFVLRLFVMLISMFILSECHRAAEQNCYADTASDQKSRHSCSPGS
jgi:hypothetical protein